MKSVPVEVYEDAVHLILSRVQSFTQAAKRSSRVVETTHCLYSLFCSQ